MAKNKAPSKHSRAARRATSPGIDTDKSLKDVAPPPRSANARPAVLAVHRAAGVQKKTRRTGRKVQMSARARRRHEKGLEMAEAVLERTDKKLARSFGRSRTVNERRKAWDVINRAVAAESAAAEGGGDGDSPGADRAWETDEDMDGAEAEALAAKSAGAEGVSEPPPPVDDEDEIL